MSEGLFPVVILAGGLATRLWPLTEKTPKALIEINDEPFIAHQMRLLRDKGIGRVVICAGYLGEMIQECVGDGSQFGLDIQFSFDGPNLLGTAGAIKKAIPLLGERFFVLYGDSYLPCDYKKTQAEFEESGKLALMTVFRNDGQWDTSNIEFADGHIITYDKQNRTSRMQHIDYGLGVFNQMVFEVVQPDEPFDLAILYQHALKQRSLAALEVSERFYEIGSPQGLEELRNFLAGESGQGEVSST